jgi:hypothetical protein
VLVTARLASESREPRRELTTPEKAAELFVDEPRQRVAVTSGRRLCAKRLVVVADDLIDDAVLRAARTVLRREAAHDRAAARAMPNVRQG